MQLIHHRGAVANQLVPMPQRLTKSRSAGEGVQIGGNRFVPNGLLPKHVTREQQSKVSATAAPMPKPTMQLATTLRDRTSLLSRHKTSKHTGAGRSS